VPPIRCLDELSPRARSSLPAEPEAFLRELGGSSLLRIPGRDRTRTRAVATLIHGNEPSGLRALHGWLREGHVPATDAVIWIASVAAALEPPLFGHRALPGRLDLNRCFLAPDGSSREHQLARAALELLRAARPEALLDLHNNTGHNPAYAVGSVAGPPEQALAALFGRFFVQSDLVLGALVEATASDFPSVTIECGRAGSPEADATARAGLARYFEADALPSAAEHPPTLLVEPLRVEVCHGVELAFGDAPVPQAGFTVDAEIDRHNFQQLAVGTPIGWLGEDRPWPVRALGASGVDVSRDYFVRHDGRLETCRELMPIMMTTVPAIARSDCLFYVVRPARGPGAV
jgi:hypothetical protein